MRFSIITPTLNRESLVRCCDSLDKQTFNDWEHLVCSDGDVRNEEMQEKIQHPQRRLFAAGPTRKWGNFQRWLMWEFASGSYIIYCDDDNEFFHEGALADIDRCLSSAGDPDFSLFPIYRHGRLFFNDPPGMCMTDTANICIKREIGRWPNVPTREADGLLAEYLKANYTYSAFPNVAPIILMEKSSDGI